MKEELISFETALLARKKGFRFTSYRKAGYLTHDYYKHPEGSFVERDDEGDIFTEPQWRSSIVNGQRSKLRMSHLLNDRIVYAFTQSLVQRWLREEHDIHVWVQPNYIRRDGKQTYSYYVTGSPPSQRISNAVQIGTYEEALEQGLIKGLKLIEL